MNGIPSEISTPRRWTGLSVAVFLALFYLVTTPGKWWPTPDSSVYVGLAESLARGDGYRFNGEISTRQAPGLPLLLAGWVWAFGTSWFARHLLIVLFSLGCLWLMHRGVRRLADARTALTVVLATGMSFPFFQNAHLILTDAPFAMLFWSVLYCLIRLRSGSYAWLIPVALLTGVALCVRIPGVVLTGPLALGLLADRWDGAAAKRRWSAAVIAAVTILTAGGFYLLSCAVGDPRPCYVAADVEQIGRHVIHQPLLLPWKSLEPFLKIMGELLTSQRGRVVAWAFSAPLVVAMIVGLAVEWRRGNRWFSVTLLLFVVSLVVLGGPEFVTPRYFFVLYPLMLLAMFGGLYRILQKISSLRGRVLPPGAYWRIVSVLAVITIAANAPRVARNAYYFAYLSHTDAYYSRLRDGEFVDLFPLGQRLRSVCPPDTVVASAVSPEIIGYVSGCRTVALSEDVAEDDVGAKLESLRSKELVGFVVLPAAGVNAKRFSSKAAERLSAALTREGAQVLFQGPKMVLYQLPSH